MEKDYVIYPSVATRISPLNLESRFKEAKKRENFPHIVGGYTRPEDIVASIKDMDERGFFKTLPKEDEKTYKQQLNRAFKSPEENPWKIERAEKTLEHVPEYEEFDVITGWVASLLLKPKELWQYKKFGFRSIADFVGSVGATIWEMNRSDYRNGYIWESTNKEGRQFITEIGGDTNADLGIQRIDITPDKTIDPTGNEVSYRPKIREDSKYVSAYHSVEISLLVALLKYVEQTGVNSVVQVDRGEQLIEEFQSVQQRGGFTTEHLSPNNPHIALHFCGFEYPIPKLDKNNSTTSHTFHSLITAGGKWFYRIYIGKEDELVFSCQKDNHENKIKPISVTFEPSEIDHLIRGTLQQCAKGLGRTPLKHALDAIRYRFSEQFKKDQNIQ